jgi:UDP:flavonoid glycosyltransferase YjiC (YdhE family)
MAERGTRILFAFVGGAGHYDPLRPIARAAVRAGHAVTFACRPSMVGVVLADGFPAAGLGPDVEEPTSVAPLVVPGIEHEEAVLRDGFARRTAPARARAIFDLGIETAPDVIVCDEIDFGAMIAAEQLGIPHASVTVLAAGSFARPELLAEPLNQVRAQVGLPPDPDLGMLGRHLVISPCPPSFRDPAFPLPPTARSIQPGVLDLDGIGGLDSPGRSHRPPWLDELGHRTVVYVTLGTIFNMESGDLFGRILDGVAPLPVSVVATIGRQLDPSSLGAQPSNVHVTRFIPQEAVLPRADLIVCHGGSGTVIAGLAWGLRSVVLAMGADQMHNAARCVELGVGVSLDPMVATPEQIGQMVGELLLDRPSGDRAARLAAECRNLPTASHALSWIEALVS